MNFLLGNAEELNFCNLIEALFTIVKSINITDKLEQREDRSAYSTACALQYCVSLAWRYVHKGLMVWRFAAPPFSPSELLVYPDLRFRRLLLQLPTCVTHLEKIIAIRNESLEPSPFMLYVSIWGPRCGNKAFTGWLKVSVGRVGILRL